MRRRLAWILLALSVALNLSFIAGFVHTRNVLRRLETREGRAQWLADHLRLDPVKRRDFENLSEDWRSRMRAMQDQSRAEIDAFWEEMLKERRDREKLHEIVNRALPTQNAAFLASVDYLIDIFDLLTPAQRRILAQMIRERSRF